MFHFYTPEKGQNRGFLTFSDGLEMKHWAKIGQYNEMNATLIALWAIIVSKMSRDI